MYNGIGLTTPRGSGTNGYVQRNLSSVRVKRNRDERGGERDEKDRERLESQLNRQPNADILEHQRKRQLEVKCAELQDMMEEQGYSAEEIEEKVSTFRLMLQEKQEPAPPPTERPVVTETHALAAANQQKNDRLREAFGISSDYVDGSSFHPDRKERAKEKREQEGLEREKQQQQKYQIIESDNLDSSPERKKKWRSNLEHFKREFYKNNILMSQFSLL
uniref:CWF21 domain-containing protein n=1 Tax=Cyprinus carpio TaxID=7962 RepID=A0A8C2IDD0_CYPCA